MATGYTQIDNPNPYYTQTRYPRRRPLSGTVGVHTAESVLDRIAPDTGGENVDGYCHIRKDAGCYHVIVDSDSVIHCVPDDHETWHIGEGGYNAGSMNWYAWGISAACLSVEWDPNDPWTQKTIAAMGKEIRAFWLRNGFNPDDPNVCPRS